MEKITLRDQEKNSQDNEFEVPHYTEQDLSFIEKEREKIQACSDLFKMNLNPEKIQIVAKSIFGPDLKMTELQNICAFPKRRIEAIVLPYFLEETTREDFYINYYLKKKAEQAGSKTEKYIGKVSLDFYKDCDNKEEKKVALYIIGRKLEITGQGLGLELECQIEDFCRKKNINDIYNLAYSNSKKGYVGAYVWSKYGYSFRIPSRLKDLKNLICFYAKKNNFEIDLDDFNAAKTPLDIANLKSIDQNGNIIHLGKDFLSAKFTNELIWEGHRDLSFKSQGTKNFVRYLKQKGRDDLVRKYYQSVKV